MDMEATTKCSQLAEDLKRHERDSRLGLTEGLSMDYREVVYRNSFTLATPTALRCLENINRILFEGVATVRAVEPHDDGSGGLIGTWEMIWPALEESVIINTNEPYPPIRVAAILPIKANRGHLVLLHPQQLTSDEGAIPVFGPNVLCSWPFQVTSEEDAEHLEPLVATVALGQIHDATVRSSARFNVLLEYETPASYGHASPELIAQPTRV